MSTEIVCVGYTCPGCGQRVAVLRSCDRIPPLALIKSKCKCGYVRIIRLEQIQELEVWREAA